MTASRTMNGAAQQPVWLLALWPALIFLAACAILFARRPDALLHAQFYAEDGHVWFAGAYNLGWWPALFRAQDGYFQTFPRLGAALALLAPMARAPLIMNLIAIAAQALPVNLLLSSRSAVWGSLRFRACLALCYLAMPNSIEIGRGITESQWLLALSVFLLLVAGVPRTRTGRCCDFVLLALSGLTGPFCIFLLPFAAFVAWTRRDPRRLMPVIVLAASCLAQAYSLLILDAHSRPHDALGATPAMFARLLGGNVFLAAVIGHNKLAAMHGSGVFALLVCAAVIGVAIVAACCYKSALEMKLFLIWTGMLFAASLLSSWTHPPAGSTVWRFLALSAGGRYWFFPSLAFAWSLLYCVRRLPDAGKIVPGVFLGIMLFSIVLDWREPALPPSRFAQYMKSFQAAPPGSMMVIPENPPGWTMRLVKHASA